jgi:phage gp36-like protein
MRDENGSYVGAPHCRNFETIERVDERVCCANQSYKVTFIKCSVKGIVEAGVDCHHFCRLFVENVADGRR